MPPQVKEDWILRETKKFGVQPFLVLTPFSEAGVFNNQLIKIVTENAEMQNTLIANILVVVQEKGYAGVDVDFEYILPEDKEGYVKFVEHLQNVMAENGYWNTHPNASISANFFNLFFPIILESIYGRYRPFSRYRCRHPAFHIHFDRLPRRG